MITIIIIAVTSYISYNAFGNGSLMERFIFYPPAIKNKQWYRFITHGVLHADWSHLIFNMFSLYLFGTAIEEAFKESFGKELGALLYVILYVAGLAFSMFPTWLKEKDNYYYRSLGASGAVSAVVFAYIMIYPMSYMGLFFIPLYLPAFLFGILYVIISIYLDRNQTGNINHSAHIAGGLFGIVFLFVTFKNIIDINIFSWFIENIQITSFRDLIHFGY